MKWLIYLSLFFFTHIHAEELMDKWQTLNAFEHFYESLYPAQEKSEEAFVWFSPIPDPFFNAVLHLTSDRAVEKAEAIIRQAADEKRPLSFWVHPENRAQGLVDALKQHGFQPMITCPLMVWDTQPIAMPKKDIRQADMDVFHDIVALVYHMEPEVDREFQRLLKDSPCENYILYEQNQPVSVCSLLVQGATGGIFNDATLPEQRDAGVQMMRFLMHRATTLGVEKLIVLSSPEGQKLYGDLGFELLFDVEIYAK
jgi:hypothetical protein